MKINNSLFVGFLSLCLIFISTHSSAQQTIEQTEIAEQKEKVKDIVAFLEYVLNTLGSKSTSARDKDVIINQSYTKIFRDSKVQIEDDLDENRDVITNKDVQAYLKDVEFFFKQAKFDFTIEDISHYVDEDGELFFKVSLIRHLQAVDIEGDSINNTKKRFIEVNLNPKDRDLKIVSIYTNELNLKEALARWWNDLSYEWKAIFKRKTGLTQTATDSDIKQITEIETLDISGNQFLTTIAPLSQLTNLKRLDMSDTNIDDIKPIRNLTKLEELNISNTPVENLEALKYAHALRYLELQNTAVTNLATVERLTKLHLLNISDTDIRDLKPISGLPELKVLNIANTPLFTLNGLTPIKSLEEVNFTSTSINNLTPLSELEKLQIIKADSTPISSLHPLGKLQNLKVLSINYTTVSTLSPLNDIPNLERIYCDITLISKEAARDFMEANPGVLVIFESDDLKSWWSELSVSWQNIFKQFTEIKNGKPSKEELAKVTSIDSINLHGNLYIDNIEPLAKLRKVEKIILSKTSVTDLSPLEGMKNLQHLDVSNTPVTDFSALRSLVNLKVFKANKTELQNLDMLFRLTRLIRIEADYTMVNDLHVREFLKRPTDCLVIFKSEYLNAWWQDLDDTWKNIFSIQTTLSPQPTTEQLHKLVSLSIIQFSDAPVQDLLPLRNFVRIKELRFSGTGIYDLTPITDFKSLEVLQATKSPLSNIAPVATFKELKVLDISNTPVSDLKAVSGLTQLTELNCSGTQVKKLRDIDDLRSLKILDISNTRVKRLDEVADLDLEVLKCYNTRISNKRVSAFREDNPDCNVIYY